MADGIKNRFTIRISSQEILSQLERLAEEKEVSKSKIVEMILTDYFKNNSQKPSSVGSIDSNSIKKIDDLLFRMKALEMNLNLTEKMVSSTYQHLIVIAASSPHLPKIPEELKNHFDEFLPANFQTLKEQWLNGIVVAGLEDTEGREDK